MGNLLNNNPYEQNVGVLRMFFRRPLTLIVAILNILLCAGTFPLFLHNPIGGMIPIVAVLIPLALLGIAYIMFFVKSRRKKLLNGAIRMLKATAIIKNIIGACFFAMEVYLLLKYLINAINNYSVNLKFVAIHILTIIFLVIYTVAQLVYSFSVGKSQKGIYLVKKGAVIYGVCSILVMPVVGCFLFSNAYFAMSKVIISAEKTHLLVLLVLLFVCLLLEGILAFKYSSFVTKMSDSYVEVPEIQREEEENPFQGIAGVTPVVPPTDRSLCSRCGKKLSKRDAFCRSCGAPVNK